MVTVVPSVELLHQHRDEIHRIVKGNCAANPRVFGSVARGEAGVDSDVDILVDALPGATLLDLGDLEAELQSLLCVRVNLLTPGDLPSKFRANVIMEAQPL